MEQIESREINPCTYGQEEDKRRPEYTMEKKTISLRSGAGKTGQSIVKE